MRLAFVLFKYFPYGGLQRDMLRIALECQQRGCQIEVYTLSWQGTAPEGFVVHELAIRRTRNHARYHAFSRALQPLFAAHKIDGVVGFNKMPGLDVYYAADPCFAERMATQKNWLTRKGARNRLFRRFEESVFAPSKQTQVLMISPQQLRVYRRHYGTPEKRLHLLPPGIMRDRMAPPDAVARRAAFRQELGLRETDRLVLTLGSGFRVKGVDRSLRALAALAPEIRACTRYIAIGQDNPRPFFKLARRLGCAGQFEILPGRDDVPRFLLGADLLLHPAYYENTGTVLLEAMVAGLPVLTTDTCGYAFHVQKALAGRVVPSPFQQRVLDRELACMLTSPERDQWSSNGVAYGRTQDLYRMPQLAADIIVQTVQGLKR